MSDKDKKLDDFWDLSDLTPKSKKYFLPKKSVEAVEIEIAPTGQPLQNQTETAEMKLTVADDFGKISRVVTEEKQTDDRKLYISRDTYAVSESPIHTVVLLKKRSEYRFYDEFKNDAARYFSEIVGEREYIPFFSYVPQYNQLSQKQLEYYLWWRENARNGNFIKTDVSYLLLYIYEIINLGNSVDVRTSQYMLTEIWNNYASEFPEIAAKLSAWICDFSLVHRLSPPLNADGRIVKCERSLKEFYISMPKESPEKCIASLLKYCSSYDYRDSKFYNNANREIFDVHVFSSLVFAWKNCGHKDGFLKDFAIGDSKMMRDAYNGALCCSDEKYRIEIEYCSFSRMNELRYQIGDMVKYAENKIRTALAVKSKLSVYSNTELYKLLDKYFELYLPPRSKSAKKPKETYEYDALYSVPQKEFSLSDAKKIELDSWETTDDLISAFDGEQEYAEHNEAYCQPKPTEISNAQTANNEEQTDILDALKIYLPFVFAVRDNDREKQMTEALSQGKMIDSLVDEVNGISLEIIGDILIEDNGEGYSIVEFYSDLL